MQVTHGQQNKSAFIPTCSNRLNNQYLTIMKKCFFVVLFAMALFCSCEPAVNSGEFDTPFLFDEVDAYFEWPFDTAVFVSNTGDTMVCTAQGEPGNYYFFSYEVEFDWQEPEKEEEYYRSIEYIFDESRALYLTILVTGRREVILTADFTALGRIISYGTTFELRKPSDMIFDFFTDTITLYNKENDQDYLYIVKGKGITEFAYSDGDDMVVWHLVE